MKTRILRLLVVLLTPLLLYSCGDQEPRKLELFFLGHDSKHHDSEMLANILSQEYFKEGMNITYSTNPEDLTSKDLGKYDGLILYANHDSISPSQAEALLDYVASGKGFIPIHSASFCFRNSSEVVNLIGGQFKSHEGGSFSAEIIKPDHPALKGVEEFTTEWDETYVHDKLADDIEVLMERVEDDHREPYTWVKNHGKGRVFYTAFGHDERTFRNPGFLQLIKSGIRWAVGEEAVKRQEAYVIAQPTYQDAHLPNYERRDPEPQYQLPLTPEESQTLIQVPVGFKLELFASEPEIKKPIAMDWDERGRLWVIETVDYPNTVRNDNGVGDDRILILEDTNNDGKADKFTVFAEGLNIPTGFVFAKGGIIVSQAPDFLFLKDTDGDDKADVKEVLIHGWGTFDTHAGPSNLKYGLDNKIWGTVGYSGFEGQIDGKQLKFGSGLYSFTPDAKDFEFKANTSNNTWGLGFSEDFDVFLSTANNEHSDFFAIPNRYYERANLEERGIQKIDSHYGMHVVTKNLRQVDVHGGFTAAAGHSLYTARSFPKEYWNRVAFVSEPTGRVIHKHVLEQEGSGFKEGQDGWNIVASADEWFGPVEAKVGPDGALWFADWYNFIIQHNPTPEGAENGEGNAYIDPLRDNTRGRIYRVVHEDAGKSKQYSLDQDKPSTLIEALKSDNMFWRTTAQRLLVESGNQDVAPELFKLIENSPTDEVNVNGAAIHAIWTLHGLGLLDGSNQEAIDVVLKALSHSSPGVRRAAVQVLPVGQSVVNQLISSNVLADQDLRVRLATLLKLADAEPSAEIGKAIYTAVQQDENIADKWISHALLIAGTLNRDAFSTEFKKENENLSLSNVNGSLVERIVAGNSMFVMPLSTERGGTIGQRRIPDFSNKEITVVADVKMSNSPRKEGVLVSEGDARNGYALFIKDKKAYFQVNQNGRKTILSSTAPLANEFSIKGQVLTAGQVKLSINNEVVAEGKTAGLFKAVPEGNIKIGHNRPERRWGESEPIKVTEVGDYPADFNFAGTLSNARLVIVDPSAVKVEPTSTDASTSASNEITINVIVGEMKYDKTEFTAKAGSKLKIKLVNPDFMLHNLLILSPGSLDKVGNAADELAKLPNGAELQYIPSLPEVLYATPLVDPNSSFELTITVPTTPGDYPFVCTFPGHWRIMKGIMKVIP